MHLLDYAISVSKKTFSALPFNEVDALVFAQISYYDYRLFEDGISFSEIQNHKNVIKATSLKNLIGDDDEKLFNVVIASRRYKDFTVHWHVAETDKDKATQFSATTFILKGHFAVIAYRGTDGTVTGWHEDLNMTYIFPFPGQVSAQKYINDVMPKINEKYVKIVGHSKGGNLATYACVMAKSAYQKRITDSYNFDGPGFIEAFYDLEAYKMAARKIHKYVPEQSSVGRMMKVLNDYKVVKSDKTYAMQHWAHSWLIDGTHFDYADSTDFFSESVELSTTNVLNTLTKEEREDAVNTMFDILYKTDCVYMDDIFQNFDNILLCLKEYTELKEKSANVKKLVLELIKPIVRVYYEREKNAASAKLVETKDAIVEKIKSFFKKDE